MHTERKGRPCPLKMSQDNIFSFSARFYSNTAMLYLLFVPRKPGVIFRISFITSNLTPGKNDTAFKFRGVYLRLGAYFLCPGG